MEVNRIESINKDTTRQMQNTKRKKENVVTDKKNEKGKILKIIKTRKRKRSI